jgi:hypothetical protein
LRNAGKEKVLQVFESQGFYYFQRAVLTRKVFSVPSKNCSKPYGAPAFYDPAGTPEISINLLVINKLNTILRIGKPRRLELPAHSILMV